MCGIKRFVWGIPAGFLIGGALWGLSCSAKTGVPLASETDGNVVSLLAAPDGLLQAEARRIAESMSDAALAGQVIMTGVDACGTVDAAEIKRLTAVQPGAVMLFGKNLRAKAPEIRAMNATLSAACTVTVDFLGVDILPFIACDHEGGAVQRFQNKTGQLPAPLEYQELARVYGEKTVLEKIALDAEYAAHEIFDLGINMNLAPVAEPLTAVNRGFLVSRSYGADPAWVMQAALQFMLGMEKGGVACILKHFPGNSSEDPHDQLPLLTLNEQELLDSLVPFTGAFKTGIPAGVMVAHSIAAIWDDKRPASLSPFIIQKKLIDGGAFYGIVLADDFSMGAISNNLPPAETILAAFNAGVDMIMAWPANLAITHRTIVSALQNGKLDRARLVNAVEHILYQKMRFALCRRLP